MALVTPLDPYRWRSLRRRAEAARRAARQARKEATRRKAAGRVVEAAAAEAAAGVHTAERRERAAEALAVNFRRRVADGVETISVRADDLARGTAVSYGDVTVRKGRKRQRAPGAPRGRANGEGRGALLPATLASLNAPCALLPPVPSYEIKRLLPTLVRAMVMCPEYRTSKVCSSRRGGDNALCGGDLVPIGRHRERYVCPLLKCSRCDTVWQRDVPAARAMALLLLRACRGLGRGPWSRRAAGEQQPEQGQQQQQQQQQQQAPAPPPPPPLRPWRDRWWVRAMLAAQRAGAAERAAQQQE